MNGNRLSKVRNQLGISKEELSKQLNDSGILKIASVTICQYENGNREPKLATWVALAKFFNVTPQYLVGWTDEPH